MNTVPASVTIEAVDYAALTDNAKSDLTVSLELKIDSPAMYELAGEELISIKQKIKSLETRREGITKPLTAAHKAVMDLFREPISFLTQAKDCLQQGMIGFSTEQERLHRIEQKRLDDLARAERERLEQEAKKLMEAAAKATGDMANRAKQQAEAAQALSRSIVSTVVENNAPVAQGNSVRKTWKGRCTDKLEFIKFVAANPAYIHALNVDQTVLNDLAKSHQDSFAIPGCEAYQEASVVSRTK